MVQYEKVGFFTYCRILPVVVYPGTPKAKHGETASSTGDMPSWDIVGRAKMVAVFGYRIQPDKDNSMMLPNGVRKYLK
jgi:hypothetical protein